jgi:DNA (cytosine-5)-methyltransferase 1
MQRHVIDLFCGIGGFGLGAARAGFNLALSIDIDPIPLEVHEINFPRCNHLLHDVAGLCGKSLLASAGLAEGELTGLVGGSPCQGFSRIGKRSIRDPRNRLFLHFFRLVAETKPSFFLAENVMGILDPQNRSLVRCALKSIPDAYRVLPPLILNAADFGAPTTRERVFFIGYMPRRLSPLSPEDFHKAKWRASTRVEAALAGLPRKLRPNWLSDESGWRTLRTKRAGKFWTKIYGCRPLGVGDEETVQRLAKRDLVSGCIATTHTKAVERRFAAVAPGGVESVSRMPRLRRNGFCPTLRAGTGADKGSFQALRPIHYSEPRVITPREAARLQGFPDWFRFAPTKWHAFRGIGNSVSPLVAEALFRVLASKLDND